jgi:hypothetical protein
MMPPGGGDLEGAPKAALPLELCEIAGTAGDRKRHGARADKAEGSGRRRRAIPHERKHEWNFAETTDGVHVPSAGRAGFGGIPLGNQKSIDSRRRGRRHRRQYGPDRTHGSVQPKLAEHQDGTAWIGHGSGRREYGNSNGKIVGGPLLREIGGSEIYKDPIQRKLIARISYCRPNPFTRFFYGACRKTDKVDARNAAAHIDLDLNQLSFEAARLVGKDDHRILRIENAAEPEPRLNRRRERRGNCQRKT